MDNINQITKDTFFRILALLSNRRPNNNLKHSIPSFSGCWKAKGIGQLYVFLNINNPHHQHPPLPTCYPPPSCSSPTGRWGAPCSAARSPPSPPTMPPSPRTPPGSEIQIMFVEINTEIDAGLRIFKHKHRRKEHKASYVPEVCILRSPHSEPSAGRAQHTLQRYFGVFMFFYSQLALFFLLTAYNILSTKNL